MLDPGRRDRLVTIEQNTPTTNAHGVSLESWSTFTQWWARRIDGSGSERFAADQRFATSTTMWRGPYIPGVRAAMRINENGNYFDIQDIGELGRHEELEILTTARNV